MGRGARLGIKKTWTYSVVACPFCGAKMKENKVVQHIKKEHAGTKLPK